MAGPWLQEFTELRDRLNTNRIDIKAIRQINDELETEITKTGREHPVPKISARAIARMEREAALAGGPSSTTLLPCRHVKVLAFCLAHLDCFSLCNMH